MRKDEGLDRIKAEQFSLVRCGNCWMKLLTPEGDVRKTKISPHSRGSTPDPKPSLDHSNSTTSQSLPPPHYCSTTTTTSSTTGHIPGQSFWSSISYTCQVIRVIWGYLLKIHIVRLLPWKFWDGAQELLRSNPRPVHSWASLGTVLEQF